MCTCPKLSMARGMKTFQTTRATKVRVLKKPKQGEVPGFSLSSHAHNLRLTFGLGFGGYNLRYNMIWKMDLWSNNFRGGPHLEGLYWGCLRCLRCQPLRCEFLTGGHHHDEKILQWEHVMKHVMKNMCEICVFTCCNTHLALGKRLHPYHCEIPLVRSHQGRQDRQVGRS